MITHFNCVCCCCLFALQHTTQHRSQARNCGYSTLTFSSCVWSHFFCHTNTLPRPNGEEQPKSLKHGMMHWAFLSVVLSWIALQSIFSHFCCVCCCSPLPCSTTPSIEVKLGTLGSLQLSPSLVLQLQQLLSVHDLSWKYEVLYVPCLVPFVVAGLATIMVHRRQLQKQNMGWQKPFILAWQKLQSR